MLNGTADPVMASAKGAQTSVDLSAAHVPLIFEPLEGAGHVPFEGFGDVLISQSVDFA
jgi:hypothetical protein